MSWIQVPQGIGPPNALILVVVAPGDAPPAAGTLLVGVQALAPVDLSAVTGATLAVRKPDGSVTFWVATYAADAPLDVSDATNATPIVLTVPSSFPVDGRGVTVAGVGGDTGANGQWFAQALSPTTVALYQDAEFTQPVAGTGVYTSGGTCTTNDSGTISHAFADPGQGLGDCDQVGPYQVRALLEVGSGLVPCQAFTLDVRSPFAGSTT